ncbi:MmgE/PrpD family protein [Brucella intermedia]|uniref:MmgE/PrpD family protein n=1 Tax=Brucella intermedia TaxID=94625 RepID=UPI00224A649E|nr:MmgE/PrpD family protein [Brucella intermedia]
MTPFALTRSLGELIAAPPPVPEQLAERVSAAFLDTIGVMLAGYGEAPVQALARTLPRAGYEADGPAADALLSGTAAHALDYDDVGFGGHMSAVLVPAILAMAGSMGGLSGKDLIRAYVLGHEVWAELASREKTLAHARGFHPTSVTGSVASAAAVASLLRLDARQAAVALSLGATQASGLTANFGSMAKPFHAGAAARAGVMAGLMAEAGFDAAPVLEAPKGYLSAFSPHGEIDLVRPLNIGGGEWMLAVRSPSVKRYPVCYSAHRALDAAQALHDRLPAIPSDTTIEVRLSPRHSEILRYRMPQTVAQARFSLEFCVAHMLLHGKLGLSDMTETGLADPVLHAAMARVERIEADDKDPELDGYAAWDQVSLVFPDGRRESSPRITRPYGHFDNPAPATALIQKFDDCLRIANCHGENIFRSCTGLNDIQASTLLEALGQPALNLLRKAGSKEAQAS